MFRNKQRAERNKNKYKNFHFDFVTDPNAINLAEDSKIKTLKKDKTGLPPIPRSTNHKTKNANFIKKNNHCKCCIQNRQKCNNTCQSQSNLNYNSRNRFEKIQIPKLKSTKLLKKHEEPSPSKIIVKPAKIYYKIKDKNGNDFVKIKKEALDKLRQEWNYKLNY